MIEVQMQSDALDAALARIKKGSGNLAPLMRGIRAELRSDTERNFETEGKRGGRLGWKDLSPVTIGLREEAKTWPGKKLQVDGSIPRGLVAESDTHHAIVGVAGVPYAAIHQLGGQAGRNHTVTIVARPYLPIHADGKLQHDTEEGILELALDYLENLVSR